MSKKELVDFKLAVALLIDNMIRDAVKNGMPTDGIFVQIGAESLELAARIHHNTGGTESGFLYMAKELLRAVKGTSEH